MINKLIKSTHYVVATFLVAATIMLFTSCDNNKMDISKLVADRDSLIELSSSQQQELDVLNNCIFAISNGIDSITQQENLINNDNQEIKGNKTNDIIKSYEELEKLIARQRSRISFLEDSLKNSNFQKPELQKMISFLNSQLEVKENEIAQLKAQVNSQKRDIKNLIISLDDSNQKVTDLTAENDTKNEIIEAQDKIINTAYIKIGTKKELMAAGIITKKFLTSAKLNIQNLNPENCNTIDIRTKKQIKLNSTKAEVLTPMPKDSYTINKTADGKSSLLIISDVPTFWSKSNYLVVLLQ